MAAGMDNDELDKPWFGNAALSYLNASQHTLAFSQRALLEQRFCRVSSPRTVGTSAGVEWCAGITPANQPSL
jgi:hypothetical protein